MFVIYLRNGESGRNRDFDVHCLENKIQVVYRNASYFYRPVPVKGVVLVDSRFPEIFEAYRKKGLEARIVNVKKTGLLAEMLSDKPAEKPGPSDTGAKGDDTSTLKVDLPASESMSPQEDPSPPESPAPSESEKIAPPVRPTPTRTRRTTL